MTLHMDIQTSVGGPYTTVDMDGLRIVRCKLLVSYTHPSVFSFTCIQPEHTYPLGINNFIRVWDDQGLSPDGQAISASNPIFEGFIRKVTPDGNSNRVRVTCYDPTEYLSNNAQVMSAPWIINGSGTIVKGIGAVPRLVLNCYLDNDDDYAHERDRNVTTGNVLTGILGDALFPARYYNAAPPASFPWDNTEVSSLTHIPQEKIVFEQESIRSGIQRFLAQWEPAVKMLYRPGARQWRFQNLYNAPEVTLTLNDPDADFVPLTLQLDRSIQDRYTAVEIYGPQQTALGEFVTSDGSLLTYNSGVVLQSYSDSTGMHQVIGQNTWQIANADYRRGSRLTPTMYYAPDPNSFVVSNNPMQPGIFGGQFILVKVPTLQVSFDGGSTYVTVKGVRFDFNRGIAYTGSFINLSFPNPPVFGSTQTVFNPTHVKLVWAYYVDPITVRYPAFGAGDNGSDFAGTAFTEANVRAVYRMQDEMLAVGYEQFTDIAITTNDRIAQFQTLAAAMHEQRSGIVYVGGTTLDRIYYDFLWLNKRINFTSVNASGSTFTTGWEAIRANLTDVEYDFEEGTTTLQFSSDHLELMGFSPEFLRRYLGVRALIQRKFYTESHSWRWIQTPYSPGHYEMSGTQYQEWNRFFDPLTGRESK